MVWMTVTSSLGPLLVLYLFKSSKQRYKNMKIMQMTTKIKAPMALYTPNISDMRLSTDWSTLWVHGVENKLALIKNDCTNEGFQNILWLTTFYTIFIQ